jgi:hypothetical protein
MALNVDTLSLWEIAFRWNNQDPHQFAEIEAIPLAVKDTLRNLASEVYFEHLYSKLHLDREAKSPVYMRTGLFKKEKLRLAVSDWDDEFRACIHDNVIDPAFLKSVFIPHWELEYWCKENNIPMPDFWIKALFWGGTTFPVGDEIVSVVKDEDQPEEVADSPQEAEPPRPLDNSEDTSQQQEAAYARHKPTHDLNRDCVRYWLAHQKFSNNEAARRFYESLPPERSKILTPTNAPRTLAKAISDYRNREKLKTQNKLPYWLIDFSPESPQQ